MLTKSLMCGKQCLVAPYIGEFHRFLMLFPFEDRNYEHYRNVWIRPESFDFEIKIDFSSPGGRLYFNENGDPLIKVRNTNLSINLNSGFAINCFATYEVAPKSFSVIL